MSIEYCNAVQSRTMALNLFAGVFFSVVGLWCFIVIYQTFKKRNKNPKNMPERIRRSNGKIAYKV